MLKISRAYLDACGYVDGVFEELLVKPVGEEGQPVHHIIHAPNGVGKTTILALLFSVFEPDRRKFLRTEINRQHKIEHYFMPGRLGVVALELVKPGLKGKPVRHVIGQIFWLTPASKGDDGEPGQRRFFAFQSDDELGLDTLPFRGLSPEASLRSLEDFTRWAREMRSHHAFFATDAPSAWRKYLTSELGIELKVLDVQRQFCATEGGIGAVFLDFKSEQQFLEKIFSFMIPSDAAESVVAALESGLAKIRGLPQRKDQLKVLTQLAEAFVPFSSAAAALQSAEAERAEDFMRLGRLFSRFGVERAKLETEQDIVGGELVLKVQELEDARKRERTLRGEVLFLEKNAAERRIADAKAELESAKMTLERADTWLRTARAADIERKRSSAEQEQLSLQAELERIERDLAPDRARLARIGANLHSLLEQLAIEAERDASELERTAALASAEADTFEGIDRTSTSRAHDLKAEIARLSERVTEHDRERKELEQAGALQVQEPPHMALARLAAELVSQEENAAQIQLQDEELQNEATFLEGNRTQAVAEARKAGEDATRLRDKAETGRKLERAIVGNDLLSSILAGEARDPYRPDLPQRARGARTVCEEAHRKITTEREAVAEELAFLDAEGVSSVPEDVSLVANALKEAGFPDAQPAEHYLAAFKPDAVDALALLRQDPARFSGVFVARMDRTRLVDLATENRLKLKGPVTVSQSSLEPSPEATSATGVVFGPFSAARLNKTAAAEEKTRLATALAGKDAELADSSIQLDALRVLIDDIRDLHTSYLDPRPEELLRRSDALVSTKSKADLRVTEITTRQEAIKTERAKLRSHARELAERIESMKRWKQDAERFSKRYFGIGETVARIPVAINEQRREEEAAEQARAAGVKARATASEQRSRAAGLSASASARREEKVQYPESDGGPADAIGTLDDLRSQYKNAERVLASKRDGQQTTISLRLETVKQALIKLTNEYALVSRGLSESDFEPFATIADLDRAIKEAEVNQQQAHDAVTRADTALNSANSRLGPVTKKIEGAEKRSDLKIVRMAEFENATAEACDAEATRREEAAEALEANIKTLERAHKTLEGRHSDIKGKLTTVNALHKRAEGHLPEANRAELPDLSLRMEELEAALDERVTSLSQAVQNIKSLEGEADDLFEKVRQLIESESFRQLEPNVSENLRRYSARNAGAERIALHERLAERIALVQGEIDNQLRDQNACLEQVRLHAMHADDLLRRAVRCSKIPDEAPVFGGERILKIKRRLSDIAPDVIRSQLGIWLDEQIATNRVPKDGAALAAEILNRIHGGRPLDIELLKPKRDAIQPYMKVDRMGVSGGEGVTVAMMLYTVIQRMAMDERTDGKTASSGGFLMLDNTYGTSNLMEHITLQRAMADVLDIQLFVTTCSEDKHVLNMFPTITRLVQGGRVLQDGIPKYLRVRSGDYLLKGSGHAA